MRLLLDNNLSPRLARCLQALFEPEHEIVHSRDKFSPAALDLEWISALSAEGGWAVLTKDLRLRTRPHERAALDRSNIVFFFLAAGWRKSSVEDIAVRLIPVDAEDCRPDRSCRERALRAANKPWLKTKTTSRLSLVARAASRRRCPSRLA